MDSSKTKISKLTDTNFSTWSYEMEMLLKAKGLWLHTQIPPRGLKEEEGTAPGKEKEGTSSTTLLEGYGDAKWQENDDRATALIGLNLTPKFYPLMKGKKTCYHVWTAIRAEFMEI